MTAKMKRLLYVILGMAAVTFLVGITRGESWLHMFMAAVALAVGADDRDLGAADVDPWALVLRAVGVRVLSAPTDLAPSLYPSAWSGFEVCR